MVARENVVKVSTAIIFILLSSACIAMQCWPAQIGCHQPSVVGWVNYLNLMVTISMGPFAPIYMFAMFNQGETFTVDKGSLIFYGVVLFISLTPWYVYARTKSYLSIAIASVLWVFFGFLFGVAVFT